MAYVTAHGGECCGIRHIATVDRAASLTRALRDVPSRRMVEIVLSEQQTWQIDFPTIKEWLVNNRFVLVNSFVNGNTENRLYVFHRTFDSHCSLGDLPFDYPYVVGEPDMDMVVTAPVREPVEEQPVQAPAPVFEPAGVPITLVSSAFHNVYRGSGRMRGHPSMAIANQRRGVRRLRVDRRDHYSDGTIVWVEDVR